MTKNNVLDALEISHQEFEVNGSEYVVTTDTGEISYGSDMGGGAAFAYAAADLEGVNASDYGDFCERVSAVGPNDPNWDELAVTLALEGIRLTIAGACKPALTDREYNLVRLAVALEG